MAQNAHIINNPMDVIQADETADIAIANGYQSIAIANGRKSQAVATETNSLAIAIADNSVATALKSHTMAFGGVHSWSQARGVIGSFLILAECDSDRKVTNVIAVKVDGTLIKPDVCYELLAGYIVPVDISERDKYPTIKVETIMRPLNDEEKQNKGVYTAL